MPRASSRLGTWGGLLQRYLPANGPVLEAGCGTGIWVRRLCRRGYDCIGLDFAVSSLVRSKAVCPSLGLAGGDVSALPFADGTLAGYVSFGVVEHFEHGPTRVLEEAARVLRTGGVALVSVPYENPHRQELATLTKDQALCHGLEFYQHYHRAQDLKHAFSSVGLRPLDVAAGYGVNKGLLEAAGPWGRWLRRIPGWSRWSFLLDYVPSLPRRAAHMIIVGGVRI